DSESFFHAFFLRADLQWFFGWQVSAMPAAGRRCKDNIADWQLIPGKDFSDAVLEVWREL
ncbi:MAG TPA: hypothetical protein H9732_09535, partial [Candidatus Mediterraneibacter avicola]|nr:hypothetical protein [Candidatus Mediterraneibacter avicola]